MYSNETFYHENEKYSNYLEIQNRDNFEKIRDVILRYKKNADIILDLGCGTGKLIEALVPNEKIFGIDVSKSSISIAKAKKINCQSYNGERIPFQNSFFDIVVSYNVLEHVDDVENFLSEALRVLKKEGLFILACPNFLSISNNFHWHTRGIKQKINNFFDILIKLSNNEYYFKKMKTIVRESIYPDDDACNVTNPLDILKWSKLKGLSINYFSSQLVYKPNIILNFIDKTPLKIFFGACFFVFKK